MSAYFITSSGTDIGKTFITRALCRQLREKKLPAHAYKPIISGWSEGEENDVTLLCEALGLPQIEESYDQLSLYRLKAPLSPDMAARQEGISLKMEEIIRFCKNALKRHENGITLIEGVGGAMVPLTPTHTTLDLIEALNIPVILIVGSYLGSLSHTLTALESLRSRNIPMHHLIINESADSSVDTEETAQTLRSFVTCPVTITPRLANDKKEYWKHLPDLAKTIIAESHMQEEVA